MDFGKATLKKVILNRDVLWSMVAHSLSTEHQEIMGLCIGRIDNNIAIVERALMIARKHKQKDRVEVSTEDLSQASDIAEQISIIDKKEMRIIAWYHSHPHITCPPSHVDVKTQGSFQALDSNFFGLIVSCFDQNQGNIDVCAFQSTMIYSDDCPSGYWTKVEVPIVVICNDSNNNRLLDSLLALQLVFLNEEKDTYDKFSNPLSSDLQNSSSSSDLEVSKSTSIYESSLINLIDTQLIPLHLSLKSKIASMQLEREEMLKRIATMNDGMNYNNNNSKSKVENQYSSKIIETLISIIPSWYNNCRILKFALNGMKGMIIQSENVNVTKNECVVSFVQSKYDLKFKRSLPWSLIIKQDDVIKYYDVVISIEDIDVMNMNINALKIILSNGNNNDDSNDNSDDNNKRCFVIIKLKDETINQRNLNSALKLDKLRH